MSSYILLRNNKEAGPYSFDELLQIDFKPYDLIWVEGKSAMWRYPSEVPELKDYSEAVEEQPYDRFYKKQSKESDQSEKQNSITQKQVYVSLPDQPATEIKTETPQLQKIASPVISVTESKQQAEVKYSKPLDEIKELYSKNLQTRKQKIAKNQFMIRYVKKTAVVLSLVTLGVFVGYLLSINKNNTSALVSKNETESGLAEILAANQFAENKDVEVIPEEINKTDNEISLLQADDIGSVNKKNILLPEKKIVSQQLALREEKEKKQQLKKQDKTELITPGAETNSITGERNKKTRNENDDLATSPLKADNDLSKMISINSNNYQRGAFGGIRNLELILTNHSKYFLDKVTVELQYLKPSEHTLRSEKIIFTKIPAEGTLTIAVPPSNRGIKVQFKIVKIESKELNTDTANL